MTQSFREWFYLHESKQDIIGLGYPEVVASLFYKRFGKYAFTIAKWYREYRTNDPKGNWFDWVHSNFRTVSVADLVALYNATTNPEEYVKALEKLDISRDDEAYDEHYLKEQREALKRQIEDRFFQEVFFNSSNTLIEDITSGKLRDIAPYKDLSFWQAQYKYDEKNIFRDKTPLKQYRNGWRWIDVGKRCQLVGTQMKNCGSAGVMSMDADRTMIVLFDPENKPHVVVTYSPNEKRISGDEGVASTPVKNKYHRYVLDLANTLGAQFDAHKSSSPALKVKSMLQGKGTNIRSHGNDIYNQLFSYNMDGQKYYSNSYVSVSQADIQKAQQAIASGQVVLPIKLRNVAQMVLNHRNQPILSGIGVKYTPLNQLNTP